MRIILIGNYLPDKQESMERFAQMMQTGFQNQGVTSELWRPVVFFGKGVRNTTAGLGKWLGYLDKWLLFPLLLRWRLRAGTGYGAVRFHICDHSNAPYLGHLPHERTGITCHDVLAIRGAMGFDDAYCPASGFGKILQKWILNNLCRAKVLATVSRLTLKQLTELAPGHPEPQQDWRVIHNAFNGHFRPMPEVEARELLHQKGIRLPEPFILHVGSGMTRKNRRMLLDMAAKTGAQWTGAICYAGQALEDELMQLAKSYGLSERVVSVTQPDHNTLVALYSLCQAFVFPSFSEGFGWPLIEAQACGAPVITSTIEPMPEVSGGAALYASPSEPTAFAEALLALQDKNTRAEFIRWGFENAANFESDRIMNAYLDIHSLAPIAVH